MTFEYPLSPSYRNVLTPHRIISHVADWRGVSYALTIIYSFLQALLSALAVSALSSPRPDEDREYKIPSVGTGRRSQYYVLHEDGTFKYGYDTGEGAYEVAKQKTPGHQHGKFGYRDPDGNDVRLVYQAGQDGFQPSGTHIPVPSQEFIAAHAEARARPPFHDPLAQTNTDASYGFRFAGEGQSRTEQSDTDGNVRGSYAYTDEYGRTRSYTYNAGRGVGFVIEGSDLPVAPVTTSDTPASTRLSTGVGAAAAAAAAATYHGAAAGTSHTAGSTSASFGSSTTFGGHRTGFRRPAVTPTGASIFRSSTATGSVAAHRTPVSPQRQYTTHGTTKYTGELANTRSTLGADGSRSFAYETSSHARSEAEDSQDNVVGNFDFVAADDGQRRAIKYEASSDTGFIAEGTHIPVGPAVPGAPSGQPTGRIVPVQEVHFVDPLADTNTDASYNFAFDSEQYSRSETADADGNVQGTYTVVDDDGTRRTYRFRAGKGVGYETEVVSTSQGARPSRPASAVSGSTAFTSTSTTSTGHGAAAPSPVVSYSSPSSGRFSTSHKIGTLATGGASSTAGTSYRTGTSTRAGTSYRTGTSTHTGTSSKFSHSRVTPARTSYTSTASREVFPGFQLHRYDDDDNDKKHGKYGYVLKFDR